MGAVSALGPSSRRLRPDRRRTCRFKPLHQYVVSSYCFTPAPVRGRLRKDIIQRYNRSSTQQSFKNRLREEEGLEAMPHGGTTWTLRPEDFESSAHCPSQACLARSWLTLGGSQWRRESHMQSCARYPICSRIETITCEHQQWCAGWPFQKHKPRPSKRIMLERSAAQGPPNQPALAVYPPRMRLLCGHSCIRRDLDEMR